MENFHYSAQQHRVDEEVERRVYIVQKETRFAATVCGFNFIPWRSRSYLTDEMSAPQLRSLQQSYTTRVSGAYINIIPNILLWIIESKFEMNCTGLLGKYFDIFVARAAKDKHVLATNQIISITHAHIKSASHPSFFDCTQTAALNKHERKLHN